MPSSADLDGNTDKILQIADVSLNPNAAPTQPELNDKQQPVQPHKCGRPRTSIGSPPVSEAQNVKDEEVATQTLQSRRRRGGLRKLVVIKLETQPDMEITSAFVSSNYKKLRKALVATRKRSKKSVNTGAQRTPSMVVSVLLNRLTLYELSRVSECDAASCINSVDVVDTLFGHHKFLVGWMIMLFKLENSVAPHGNSIPGDIEDDCHPPDSRDTCQLKSCPSISQLHRL
nr:hypothetical protein HmN_000841000 [Hymenolepis microstoma]